MIKNYSLLVYIVKCSDESYYTGVTNNLNRRISEHNNGRNPGAYTFKRRPVELMFAIGFDKNQDAFDFETKIKGWSRKKKEALFKSNWDEIHELSKCNNESSHLFYWKEK